jgi:uncharacterized glyoxalase superfamily protein PhnB
VVIGVTVEDLEAIYASCVSEECEITTEPMDEAWGERVFACTDPFGYEWGFSHPISDMGEEEGAAAVKRS